MLRALRPALAALALVTAAPAAADKQEGYYYPPVTSEEEFTRNIMVGPVATKDAREAFVTLINAAQTQAPDAPAFALFAKGGTSRRLIMVGLDDQLFKTLFRARAVMAQLTYNLRATPFFRDQNLETTATFYDMLQLLDFESLSISDGETWAHRVYFK